MSFFKGFGIGSIGEGIKVKKIFEKEPSIIEKIDLVFTDVETEGKKRGYKKAAKEYEEVFRKIESEYKETEDLIKFKRDTYENQSERLMLKLSELENLKKSLENQLERKTKDVSIKYNIPVGNVRSAVSSGTLIGIESSLGILDLIYSYKEKKLKKAEQSGYLEAKELYEEKIARMKNALRDLKKSADADIRNLINLIGEILEAIVEEEMKIAELKILL